MRLAILIALSAPFWLWRAGEYGIVPGAVALLVVLGLVLADYVLSVHPSMLTAERVLHDRLPLGEVAEGRWKVGSRSSRGLKVELFDEWPATLERQTESGEAWPRQDLRKAPEPQAMLQVPPAGEATQEFRLIPRERGTHRFGRIALRVPGPLGLIRRTARVDVTMEVLVTPSLAGVRHYRLLALHHRLREAGVRAVRRRGEGTSFSSLRDYVPGDDPRRIDWKATARRSRLTTREQDVEQGQTIIIAVDAGRRMLQMAGDRPRFEHALNSTLVLADVAAQSGDRVGLLVFDDMIRAWVAPARSGAALERIREALVPIRSSMAEPDYAAAVRALTARHRKRALVVIFTDIVDARSAQALAGHLTRGGARHLPLIVALRDDSLLDVAAGRVRLGSAAVSAAVSDQWGSAPEAYERAAAEELLLSREEALIRMRRSGASVVDVSPRTMAGAVVNRYLELKRRGTL
jgi:uncharacterized protein (DUF58 family)